MKRNTGIIRKVDELGRFVLPKELRDSMTICRNDHLDISQDGEEIVVTMAEPGMGIGVRRRLDCLGRLVLPKELRDTLDIVEGTPLEIYINGENEIRLRKHAPGCVFCHNENGELFNFEGKTVCRSCIQQLSRFTGARRMTAL